MRLLFVDDETEILAGLRRLFFDVDENWELEFASSGADALALLDKTPFDVVVSDMRMPGMDGVSFLAQVRQDHPKAIRLILSGQTDEESAIRALSIAHQFLSKPIDAHSFCKVIEQTAKTHALMQDEKMRDVLGNLSRLPPVPELYQSLTLALSREDTKTSDVVRLIQHDPTMSAKLLQVANSAFFARRIETADLQAAVVHLGQNTIRHLVLTVELFDASGLVAHHFKSELDAIREQAIKMATVADILGGRGSLKREAFTMGLLADIGQLVLAIARGDDFRRCRKQALSERRPMQDVEREVFGVSHAEAGGFLLGIWGLPFSVVEAVAHHHHPEEVVAEVMGPAAISAIASAVVCGDELDENWLSRLGVKERVTELRDRFGPGGAS